VSASLPVSGDIVLTGSSPAARISRRCRHPCPYPASPPVRPPSRAP